MLTTNFIRENREKFIEGLEKRNFKKEEIDQLWQVISFDNKRKALKTELDGHLARINKLSKEIGLYFRKGEKEKAERAKKEVAEAKENSRGLETELRKTRLQVEELLLSIPNIPHFSVPRGSADEDNEIHKPLQGKIPPLVESALPHWDLAEKYDIIDFKLGAKLTGSGFPVFKGKGSKLERSLISFFLDQATENGYLEIMAPIMVNEDSARGTGNLPDKEGQMYHIEREDFYLIPTAEVPLTNIYRNVILKQDQLPIKLTGYTPCFRREAGSYGAHVKGLNRVHQFDKVEIVHIVHPDYSYQHLDKMIDYVEGLLIKLELPYRILRLCGGDLGFTSALTFDFEVYSAAQKKWLEVSSVSNFETYQSNRMKLRFRDEAGKTNLAHTLNGSALALPRIVAALLENNQTAEGIVIPEILRKYTGFDIIN